MNPNADRKLGNSYDRNVLTLAKSNVFQLLEELERRHLGIVWRVFKTNGEREDRIVKGALEWMKITELHYSDTKSSRKPGSLPLLPASQPISSPVPIRAATYVDRSKKKSLSLKT